MAARGGVEWWVGGLRGGGVERWADCPQISWLRGVAWSGGLTHKFEVRTTAGGCFFLSYSRVSVLKAKDDPSNDWLSLVFGALGRLTEVQAKLICL